ncbi:MAG: hypothetical protein ACR2RL_18330 [Gammaproteobacteria bacterium]
MRDRSGNVVCERGQCERSAKGLVFCSSYEDGAATRNRYGEVVCGKGECTRTSKGEIVCSAVAGGAVAKDRKGRVHCEGRCERASVKMCGQSGGAKP